MRIERDSMGEVKVPSDAYYGASTQRAVENFPISGIGFSRRFIWALGLLKGSAARVSGPAGYVDAAKAEAVARAALTRFATATSTPTSSSTSSRPARGPRRT